MKGVAGGMEEDEDMDDADTIGEKVDVCVVVAPVVVVDDPLGMNPAAL